MYNIIKALKKKKRYLHQANLKITKEKNELKAIKYNRSVLNMKISLPNLFKKVNAY